MKNPIRRLSLLPGVITLALLLSGCNLNGTKEDTAVNTEPKGATSESEIPVKEFAMESFTEIIDGKYFPQYSLKELTVNKGDLVRLKITTTSGTHNIKIDEFNVFSETPLNKEVVVEFVADKAGEFVYYCTMPGHRENGHWGTLRVLE